MMICKRHPVKNLQGFQIGMPIFFRFHAGSAAFPRNEGAVSKGSPEKKSKITAAVP